MAAKNLPKIKSINEEYGEGDMVLIKNEKIFSVGKHNVTFIEIIRPVVEIPKCELELELDKKKAEEEEKIRNLEMTLIAKTEEEKKIELQKLKREQYFDRFKRRMNAPELMTIDDFFRDESEAGDMLDYYIIQMEGEDEDDSENPDDENDDGGDGAY
jgi:hypothetical protein